MKQEFQYFKSSFQKSKDIFTVFAKDIFFWSLVIFFYFAYYAFMLKIIPKQPGFTAENIFGVSQGMLDNVTREIQAFFIIFFLATIAFIALMIFLHAAFKEWVWSGLMKKKCEWKAIPKFAGLNTIMYFFIDAILIISAVLLGVAAKKFSFVPAYFFDILAYLALLAVLPITLQLANFSAFSYLKTRSFKKSITSTVKSFKHYKKLVLPYAYILLVFFVLGFLTNLLRQDMFTQAIDVVLFLLFFAWQKVYIVDVFKNKSFI